MTGYRFFHILGIWSSYTEDSTFLITGNSPALRKVSLARQLKLMFELFTHTRFCPVILSVIDIQSKILFYFLIDSFSLFISLRW